MAQFELPEFRKGGTDTLLEAKNASIIKQFIQAFQNIEIIEGDTNEVLISKNNVKIKLKKQTGTGFREPIKAELTFAGVVPERAEIKTAIENAYTSYGVTPRQGDFIFMEEFHFLVFENRDIAGNQLGVNNEFKVLFEVDGVSYVAFQIGPNRLI